MKLPELKPLELSDKPVFDRILSLHPPITSEHTFTNFFIWRNYHRFAWAPVGEWIVVMSAKEGAEPCFWGPMGSGDDANEIVAACLEHLAGKGVAAPSIKRAPKTLVEKLSASLFDIAEDRDQFDYVYRLADVVALQGRDNHQKKNHLNKFMKSYAWSYENLDPANAAECRDMQAEWCDLRECSGDESLAAEDRAVWEALEHFGPLGLMGGVLRVDGKIEAFTIAERLNANTAVEHIEKANPKLDGIYVAINNSFAKNGLGGFEFVNREQDLGIEGLRRAKQSWNPAYLAEKYIVRLK